MPNESINLYFSIQSGSSERTLTSLTDKTKALDKETQLLQQATEGLARANKPLLETQAKLQAELKASQKSVNELQKAYDEYGDEVSRLKLDAAIEEHSRLKQELTEVNAQIGANQKTYKEYLETVRKGGLQESGGSSLTGESTGWRTIAKGLLAGQIGQIFSSSLGGLGETMLTSAMGTPTASLISDTLSSAISGCAGVGISMSKVTRRCTVTVSPPAKRSSLAGLLGPGPSLRKRSRRRTPGRSTSGRIKNTTPGSWKVT